MDCFETSDFDRETLQVPTVQGLVDAWTVFGAAAKLPGSGDYQLFCLRDSCPGRPVCRRCT